MNQATLSIRAHFDGKVIVPDEPVDLPINAALDVDVRKHVPQHSADAATIARRLAALEQFGSLGARGVTIADEQLRRENLYADSGR